MPRDTVDHFEGVSAEAPGRYQFYRFAFDRSGRKHAVYLWGSDLTRLRNALNAAMAHEVR